MSPTVCPECGKQFDSEDALLTHEETRHNEEVVQAPQWTIAPGHPEVMTGKMSATEAATFTNYHSHTSSCERECNSDAEVMVVWECGESLRMCGDHLASLLELVRNATPEQLVAPCIHVETHDLAQFRAFPI